MKKGPSANEAKPAKKAKTSADITSKLLKNIQDALVKQLSTGKMTINPVPKSLPKQTNMEVLRSSNPEEYFQSIQSSLKALRSSIEVQRRAEKGEEKLKLAKAQELIERMRREREEHREKLRENNQKEVLHRRLYSETTLNEMKQKLEERIASKRLQIEERVKAIEERKKMREGQAVSQEVEYWQRRQEMKQKAKSSIKLPALSTPSEDNAEIFPTIPRHGSFGVIQPARQAQQYEKQAGRLMRLAKLRQDNIKLKQFEENYSSRLGNIIRGHQGLQEQLAAKPSFKSSELPAYADNRHKIMGNEFLKESLLLVRRKPTSSDLPALPAIEDSLQLSAHEAQLNKNQQVEALREKWARMLSKVRHGEITSEQGLELLNSLEKRLDKVDLAGVQARLKQKYEVFSGHLPLSIAMGSLESESAEVEK